MKSRVNNIFWIYVSYVMMLLLCIILFVWGNADFSTLIINLSMFVIVGLMYWNATKKLRIARDMTADFKVVNARIVGDVTNAQGKEIQYDPRTIFTEKPLLQAILSYAAEERRVKNLSNGTYKCRISDFINRELVDKTIHKGVINLIPGSLTGLGILGTFIGLSIGLQNFNTGSATEIADSIAPLMDGIKVAFHTSIYGMFLSLTFNLFYRREMEECYYELDHFIFLYSLYISRDAENDNFSNLQRSIQSLPKQMGELIVEGMKPSFDKLNDTLIGFTEHLNENQIEGVANIVTTFVEKLDDALQGSLSNLGTIINETSELQKRSNEYVKSTIEGMGEMVEGLNGIRDATEKTISSLGNYVAEMETLQGAINENFMNVNLQLEENREEQQKIQEYIAKLVEYEDRVTQATKEISGSLDEFGDNLQAIQEETSAGVRQSVEILSATSKESMEMIKQVARDSAQELSTISNKQVDGLKELTSSVSESLSGAAKSLSEAANGLDDRVQDSLNHTFESMDDNMAEIARHFSGTISEIDATTERVPGVVAAAYEAMSNSYDQLQSSMDALNNSVKNIQGIIGSLNRQMASQTDAGYSNL